MRWWIYQKERFPLLANGLLVAAFSSCALLYSSYLSEGPLPGSPMFLVAFITCLPLFQTPRRPRFPRSSEKTPLQLGSQTNPRPRPGS